MKSIKFFSGIVFSILAITACSTVTPKINNKILTDTQNQIVGSQTPSSVETQVAVTSQTSFSAQNQITTINLQSLINRQTSLTGTAQNAKGGAILLINETPIYIESLDSWPDNYFGKQVEVTGKLTNKKYLPEAKIDKSGAISQGVTEGQTDYVFEKATWKLK